MASASSLIFLFYLNYLFFSPFPYTNYTALQNQFLYFYNIQIIKIKYEKQSKKHQKKTKNEALKFYLCHPPLLLPFCRKKGINKIPKALPEVGEWWRKYYRIFYI